MRSARSTPSPRPIGPAHAAGPARRVRVVLASALATSVGALTAIVLNVRDRGDDADPGGDHLSGRRGRRVMGVQGVLPVLHLGIDRAR